ncbi:hypothetical protein L3Y34_016035 [Caenorhabditis briggsae]|uniref:SPK domain-containing protein n=1 Tax=Caenorhabditis briggsae TaxID=6238 RepID=A0AAE9J0K4_CAEBR|nr:hypothetical protein L3Y34_016035 [Caenorhabditis briggsae]
MLAHENPEAIQIMQFIAQKALGTDLLLDIDEICEEFSQFTDTKIGLKSRLAQWTTELHTFPQFDNDTKVQMMFRLSAPVDPEFLEELRIDAEVVLDDQERIVVYTKNDGCLELNVRNGNKGERFFKENEKHLHLLKWIAKKLTMRNIRDPQVRFLREYSRETETSLNAVDKRLRKLKDHIYRLSEFDKATKVKLMYVSNTCLLDSVLEELRKNAEVIVDRHGKILKYKANDGSLEIGDNARNIKRKLVKEDILDVFRFVAGISENLTAPVCVADICGAFLEKTQSMESIKQLAGRIYHGRANVQNMKEFDTETKVKILYALRVPIHFKCLSDIEKIGNVELDSKQRITKYVSKDGSLEIPHSFNTDLDTDRPDNALRFSLTSSLITTRTTLETIPKEKPEEPPIKRTRTEKSPAPVEPPQKVVSKEKFCGSDKMKTAIIPVAEKPEGPPTTSLCYFLNIFQSALRTLDSPLLAEPYKKMEDFIHQLEGNDHIIPAKTVLNFAESCFLSVTKSLSVKLEPGEETISLRDFLVLLKAATGYFRNEEFHKRLEKMLADLEEQDKVVSMTSIRSALNSTLDILQTITLT